MKEFDPSKVLQDRRESSPREVSFVVSENEILGEKIFTILYPSNHSLTVAEFWWQILSNPLNAC